MPEFAYEARDLKGVLQAGLVEAADIQHAGTILGSRGLFVTKLAKQRAVKVRRAGRAKANRTQVVWIISQLAVMLETGIMIGEALDCLTRQTMDPNVRAVLESLANGVREGSPLSKCMDDLPKTFPSSLRALVRSAEMSGTLSKTLNRSAEHMVSELQLIRRARGAAVYPASLLLLCGAVIVLLMTVILPRFTVLFEGKGQSLPVPTQLLIVTSELVSGYWYAWIACGTTIGLLLAKFLSTESGRNRFDALIVRLPVIGRCYNLLYQARSLRTMSVLLDAGLPLSDIIPILRQVVTNREYQNLWDEVDQAIHAGQPMCGPILASDLFPESVGQMIASGDRSGKLGLVCNRLASFVEAEHEQSVRTATQFIEPAMILLMGGFVAFIAAALMIPLFQSSMVVAG